MSAQNEMAFGQKALSYLDGLYNYAMILCHSQSEAEDLVQKTYLHAVSAFCKLAPGRNTKAWLYATLRNIWCNQVRQDRSSLRTMLLEQEADCSAIDAAASGIDQHRTAAPERAVEDVRRAVIKLSPPHRELIVLREFESFSYQEISMIVGVPAGAVMSRLGRARDRLRDALDQSSPPQPGVGLGTSFTPHARQNLPACSIACGFQSHAPAQPRASMKMEDTT